MSDESPGSDDALATRYPSTARIWNYQLGGTDNFDVDRQASAAANDMVRGLGGPTGAETAIESRHLLQRMVDYMLGQGVRRFLDLGSGLPNMASTHQVANRRTSDARVVYVDIDPLIPGHSAALTAGPGVVTVGADVRDPDQLLSQEPVRELFGAGEPVGVMFMNLLHCLWDSEDPWGIVSRFKEAAPPGSYLALTHMTSEIHPDAAEGLFRMTQQLHWNTPLISRDRASIARFFEGFILVEPGLVAPAQWRPDLHDPLRDWHGPGEPVLKPMAAEPPGEDRGIGWHYCGIGVKNA